MKKLYFLSVVTALLFTNLNSQAQSACPGPNPPIVRNFTYVINGQQVCAVYVENMIPNSPVTLFGPGLTVIPTASGVTSVTDATGFACHIFACNQIPVRVSTCNVQGCCSAPVPAAAFLPVRLTSFSGRIVTDNTVNITWTSVLELNSEKYVVERSTDGRNFLPVGTIAAAGHSINTVQYQFKDQLPTTGAYFYRLNQVDIDGKSEYSKVVYVNNGKGINNVVKIFPNPFQNEIQLIGITAADLNKQDVKLYTIGGKQVPFRITGSNALSIDESSPKGIYLLKVKEKTFKLIKN